MVNGHQEMVNGTWLMEDKAQNEKTLPPFSPRTLTILSDAPIFHQPSTINHFFWVIDHWPFLHYNSHS
jgi:hypothetical protein